MEGMGRRRSCPHCARCTPLMRRPRLSNDVSRCQPLTHGRSRPGMEVRSCGPVRFASVPNRLRRRSVRSRKASLRWRPPSGFVGAVVRSATEAGSSPSSWCKRIHVILTTKCDQLAMSNAGGTSSLARPGSVDEQHRLCAEVVAPDRPLVVLLGEQHAGQGRRLPHPPARPVRLPRMCRSTRSITRCATAVGW